MYYAHALISTAEVKDALLSLEEAQRILDANGDQTSLIRVVADITLSIYWRGRDVGRSRSYATKAVEICRRHHPNDQFLAYALFQAAATEKFAHHTEAAIEFSKEEVELDRRLGVPEMELIESVTMLAELERDLSRFADAERHFKEGIALSLRVNGEDHIGSVYTRMSYSTLLRTLGRLRESEVLLSKAADTAVRLLGPEELLYVPSVRWSLADALADLGKIEEAESLYRQAIATTEKNRPNTLSHAGMLESAGLLQLLMGRYELADHMLAQAQSIMEHIGREDSAHEALLRAHYQLAVGEPNRALSTLATTTFAEGKALQRSLVADVVRARALLELGRPDEAERVASTSLGRLSSTPEAEALVLNKADLLLSHGLAFTRLGRAKEATKPLRDALAWREANLDEPQRSLKTGQRWSLENRPMS